MEDEVLNIFELEEALKKNKPLRFIKNKKNISQICIIIAYEVSSILYGMIPYTIIVNLIVPFILRKLHKEWKKLDDINGIIVEEIRNSSDYKQCIKLYDEYIKRLAEHISKFNFETVKEIILYFDLLLKHGYLSSNFKNVYHNYKDDRNYIVELLGARVLSGSSVCRHTSSLAADCLNTLGYKAELITVKTVNDLSEYKKMEDFKNVIWEHGVVGIIDNSSKFLYDSTASRLCGKSKNSSLELKDYIADITFTEGHQHLLINPQQYVFSKRHNSLTELMSLPLEDLNEAEIFSVRKRLVDLLGTNQELAYKFAIENFGLAKEIATLESCICPHSDESISSWCLKK